MNRRRFCTALLSAVLALMPAAAFATGEDVLEPAPALDLPDAAEETVNAANTAAEVPYLPYAYLDEGRSDNYPEEKRYNLPRLTEEEAARAARLAAEMKEDGKLSGNVPDCLNRKEDVAVGVYALNPEDFDGETFYVILPDSRLSDDMLRSVIAAFDRLGIPFDPVVLNGRNCIRGTPYGNANRGLSYEESERMKTIRQQVHRGMIDPASVQISSGCLYADLVETADTYFSSEPVRFCIYPYRSMTDGELAAFAFVTEGVWDIDPALIEKQAMAQIRARVNVPLALEAEDEQMVRKADGTRIYQNRFTVSYLDDFSRPVYPDGKPGRITVWQEQAPDENEAKASHIWIEYYVSESAGTDGPEYSEEDWKEAARQRAKEILRLPEEQLPAEWEVVPPETEDTLIAVSAHMGSDWLTMAFSRRNAGLTDFILWIND